MVSAVFTPPPRWSGETLERDVAAAVESFRREREQEPLEQYLRHLDECLGTFEELVELTVDLAELRERAVEVVTLPEMLEALRFVAGPPISVDDLRVIARTTLAPTRLRADPEAAARIVDSVRLGLDRRRFPWVAEGARAERGGAGRRGAGVRGADGDRAHPHRAPQRGADRARRAPSRRPSSPPASAWSRRHGPSAPWRTPPDRGSSASR